MTALDFKEARARLDWTQQQLALALGVSPRAVRYYEAGTRKVPATVEKLLGLLGGNADALP